MDDDAVVWSTVTLDHVTKPDSDVCSSFRMFSVEDGGRFGSVVVVEGDAKIVVWSISSARWESEVGGTVAMCEVGLGFGRGDSEDVSINGLVVIGVAFVVVVIIGLLLCVTEIVVLFVVVDAIDGVIGLRLAVVGGLLDDEDEVDGRLVV